MFCVKFLNVQGLTNVKYTEISKEIQPYTMVCLTETQKKVDDIRVDEKFEVISSMRQQQDRKGGGLMVIYEEREDFYFEKQHNNNADLLMIRGRVSGEVYNMIIVYLKTGNDGATLSFNRVLIENMQTIIDRADGEKILILGDFNCHLGYLGYQEENQNGRLVQRFVEDNGLVLLNADDRCTGEYTWERGMQRSAIDLAITNQEGYSGFENMWIDEERDVLDISDHNLVAVNFRRIKRNQPQNQWKKQVFYSLEAERLRNYREDLAVRLSNENPTLTNMERHMREAADANLKRVYRRKTDNRGNTEPPWVNEDIRAGRRERRRLNKIHRQWRGAEGKEEAWQNYQTQRMKVKKLISTEMMKYENKIAEEIRENKNSVGIWKNIDKIRGKKNLKPERLKIFDENGIVLQEEATEKNIQSFWSGVFGKHENNMQGSWNETIRGEYEQQLRVARQEQENATPSMIPRIQNPYKKMKVMEFQIETDEIIKVLKHLKNRKAAGNDLLKAELFKELLWDNNGVRMLRDSLQNIVDGGGEPQSWKESRTVMIPKTRKPMASELRPIAITPTSYKILMSTVKDALEKHIMDNGMAREEQAGFTGGREILDNLVILRETIQERFKRRLGVVALAVDFRKAYDSIRREKIIEVLKEYRVPAKLIDLIGRIYEGDMTFIELGEGKTVRVDVTSGIRQGCTLSTTLFKLITYKIIEELRYKLKGVETGRVRVSSLFYADDGLVLSESLSEASKSIEVLKVAGDKYGLELNMKKSEILVFNIPDPPAHVDGIKVVRESKYLGVKVQNDFNLFAAQKLRIVNEAKRMSNMAFSVIEKSCHKTLIGKTYWKSVVIPSVLYGVEAVNFSDTDAEKLQRLENSVMRRILKAPKYATIAGMRGEVGIGTMKSRLARGRIQYVRRKIQGENRLIIGILDNMRRRGAPWWRRLVSYLDWAGIREEELTTISCTQVKNKIADKIKADWQTELWQKSTLWLYRMYKPDMREEDYQGGEASRWWFRARTNCMGLSDRNVNGERGCKVCGHELEDLQHFLLNCPKLSKKRVEALELQRPGLENEAEIMGNFLFGEGQELGRREILLKMVRERGRLLEVVE